MHILFYLIVLLHSFTPYFVAETYTHRPLVKSCSYDQAKIIYNAFVLSIQYHVLESSSQIYRK